VVCPPIKVCLASWVLVLLRLSRLVQFRVPWGIGGCHLDPVWDEIDSAHEPFDRNTSERKKKLPRRWSGGLSLLFIKCLWHFTRTKMDCWHLVFASMVPIITSCQVSPLALPCHLNGASEASTSHECLCSHSPNLHPVPLLLPSLRHGLRHRISLLRSQQ